MKYKIRFRTHLIIILTSLFWVLIDVFLLMFFADKNPYCVLKRVSNESRHSYVKNVINPKILTPIALTSAVLKSSSTSKIHQALKPNPKIDESDYKGPGALGTGVVIPEEMKALQKEKFALNQFNLVASEMISLNRSLQDHRLPGCLTKNYNTAQLKPTSVVIVFHNEAWTTLLRTIHSIINRSPAHLVADIVLVDDASDREFLKRSLDDYLDAIRHSVSIQMIRLKERSGLIKARLIGAHAAAGPIITFLDAHCEVGIGWLEPLLYEIYLNRTNVAAPIIDVISDETFEYVPASDMTWGGFNWHLNFRWYTAPPRELERRMGDRTLPVLSPTMAGGLFAIDKSYFQELGEYDPGMEVWGGENLEMSFRIWMCGGTLEIVTCSRVGHVFRKTSPYTFPGGVSRVINKNQRRTAEVWLDEWKNFYFKINPSSTSVEAGDITDRLELRKKLQCKSFKWYLENVYPESQMPREFISLGEIKHESLNMCFDTMGRKGLENIGLFTCHNQGGNQVFMYSAEKLLQNDDLCLQPDPLNKFVIMSPCNTDVKAQQWIYDKETQTIQNADSKLCITLPLSEQFDKIPLSPCSKKGQAQKWHFVNLSL